MRDGARNAEERRPGVDRDRPRNRIRGQVLDAWAYRNGVKLLREVTSKAEAWSIDFNQVRPHSSLGYLTPMEFAVRQNQAGLSF